MKQVKNETKLMSNIYNQLTTAINSNDRENIGELVGTYFVCDYYTLTNKSLDQIGGINYFYSDKKE